jgi:hypothetical protein
LIPIAELTPLSLRQGGVSGVLTGYTVPSDLITYIFPTWFMGRDDSKIGATLSYTSFYYDFASYVGIISLLLALIAIFMVNNNFVSFFTILFFVSAILRLGFLTPLYSIIMCIPGFNFLLSPTRFCQITTLTLSVLSGFGISYILEKKDSFTNSKEFFKKRFPWIIFFASFHIYPYLTGHAEIRSIKANPPIFFWGVHTIPILSITILFTLLLLLRTKKRVFIISTTLLVITDLFLYGINYNPRIHPSEALAPSELVKYLKEEKGIFRIYQFYKMGQFAKDKLVKYENLILTPDLNAYYDVSSTQSRLSFRLKRLEQINDLISRELYNILYSLKIQKITPSINPDNSYPQTVENWDMKSLPLKPNSNLIPILTTLSNQHPMLDISNVRYLLTPDNIQHPDFKIIYEHPIRVYENKNNLPRAYFVSKGIKNQKEESVLNSIRNKAISVKEEVFIENDDNLPLYNPEKPVYKCDITHYDSMTIDIEVKTDKSGYLVLTDTFYPGWIAKINGEPAKILLANYFFRALKLDHPGKYYISFEFKPYSYKLGLFVSLFSISISCAFVIFLIMQKKKMKKQSTLFL